MRDSVQVAPCGAENTHWNIHKRHLRLRGNYRQFFESSFSDVNGVQTERTDAPRCGGALEISMSCCMCEPLETAQSLLAMTHMRWLSDKRGHESTESLGCELGPWTCAQTGTRAKVKARPRPLVSAIRRAEKSRSDKTTLSKFTCGDDEHSGR